MKQLQLPTKAAKALEQYRRNFESTHFETVFDRLHEVQPVKE
jgi:hypothetical protein